VLAVSGLFCPHIHESEDNPRHFRWAAPQRRLAHYLLVASLEGAEQITVGGERYLIRPGQSYLVQPNVVADLGSERGNRPVWIHFDLVYNPLRDQYRRARDFDAELGDRKPLLQPSAKEVYGVDLPVLVPPSLAPLFRDEIRRVVRRFGEHDELSILDAALGLSRLLFTWVSQRWQELQKKSPLSSEARIRRAEAVARARLRDPFRVSDFAEAAGFGRTRFSTLYRALRGVAPGTFLRHERIRLACHLLRASDVPIGEVGASVGYSEPTVFGRVFRAQVGKSPSEFRHAARRAAQPR
jgi:AraC-like DNA-binding protein